MSQSREGTTRSAAERLELIGDLLTEALVGLAVDMVEPARRAAIEAHGLIRAAFALQSSADEGLEGAPREPGLAAAVESPSGSGLEVDAATVAILKAKLGPRVCATCGRGPDDTVVYRAVQDLVLCDGCVERAELAAKGRAHDAIVHRGPAAEITKVCAWRLSPECLRHISGPPQGPDVSLVSHGMCSSCFAIQSARDAAARSVSKPSVPA